MENVQTAAVRDASEPLVGGEAKGGAARGDAEVVAVGEVAADAVVVDAHAEQHRRGFVDGKGANPVVPDAPGGEGGDAELDLRRHVPAQAAEQIQVEGTLRGDSIEIDLECGEAGLAGDVEDLADHWFNFRCAERGGTCLDANHRHRLAAFRDEDGLETGPDDDGVSVGEDGLGEEGDTGLAAIEKGKILGPFPGPEIDASAVRRSAPDEPPDPNPGISQEQCGDENRECA